MVTSEVRYLKTYVSVSVRGNEVALIQRKNGQTVITLEDHAAVALGSLLEFMSRKSFDWTSQSSSGMRYLGRMDESDADSPRDDLTMDVLNAIGTALGGDALFGGVEVMDLYDHWRADV